MTQPMPKEANSVSSDGLTWRGRKRAPKSMKIRYSRDCKGNHWRHWWDSETQTAKYTPVTRAHMEWLKKWRVWS